MIEQYITEAHRVLESGGKLYIIDSTKRWSDANEETGIIEERMEGNRLKNILVEKSFQIINCDINKFCLFRAQTYRHKYSPTGEYSAVKTNIHPFFSL